MIGSIDVDLAFDHKHLSDETYQGIKELLLERDYKEGKQPFIFHRTVNTDGTDVTTCKLQRMVTMGGLKSLTILTEAQRKMAMAAIKFCQ